jgi:trk system potassium uptake protein TrkH
MTIPNDNLTIFVFGSLLFIGSLGVPVVADLLAMRPGYRFTLHTRLTLIFIAILMALSTLVIFNAESFNSGVLADEPVGRQLGLSLFQSISARTAGFVGVPSFELLTPASQLMIILVMFIGAAPASMGGGITTGTAIALLLSLWSYSRNRPYPEVSGRSITTITIRRATAVLTIALIVVFVATLLLLVDDPTLSLDAAIFEVVSAFATCGLTLAYTPVLSTFGRYVIILVMIWGRLGALTIMIAINRPTQQPLYSFPEEQILIG